MLHCTDGLFLHKLGRPVSQGRSPTLDQAVRVDEVVTHTHTHAVKDSIVLEEEKKGGKQLLHMLWGKPGR